jgi:hypothetical protein
LVEAMKDLKLADRRDHLVRHCGHGPERANQTGIGPFEVSRVKVGIAVAASNGGRMRLPAATLHLWARWTRRLDSRL